MMQEDYVSFETAKLLKEKGFDGKARGYYHIWDGPNRHPVYDDDTVASSVAPHLYIPAPTLHMAMKWLREKGFYIFVPIEIDYDEDERGDRWYHQPAYYPEIRQVFDGKIMCDDGSLYATPEQACEAGIKYCLENLI